MAFGFSIEKLMNNNVDAYWRKVDKRQLGVFSCTDDCFIENLFLPLILL